MNRNTTTHPALTNMIRSATMVLLVVLASIVFAGDAQAILLEGLDAKGGHAVTADGAHYVSYMVPSRVSPADDTITAAVLSITSLRGGPSRAMMRRHPSAADMALPGVRTGDGFLPIRVQLQRFTAAGGRSGRSRLVGPGVLDGFLYLR